MERDVVIVDENLMDFKDQELEGLKALLECDYLNIDTTPEELPPKKKISYKICKCGSYIQKNHLAQYRCGLCGCIIYDKKEV